jgi:hypothetical protein
LAETQAISEAFFVIPSQKAILIVSFPTMPVMIATFDKTKEPIIAI